MPGSATPEEQLADAAIDASAIAAAAQRLVSDTASIQSGTATRPFTSRS
jgi:hypothetical protein